MFVHVAAFQMKLAPHLINEYCHALSSDAKFFRNYVKVFFQSVKWWQEMDLGSASEESSSRKHQNTEILVVFSLVVSAALFWKTFL